MAGEFFSMGGYKLTALTVRTQSVDVFAYVTGARNWIVYRDGVSFAMGAFKATALVVKTANPDILASLTSAREWLLYLDAPSFAIGSFKPSTLTVKTANPDIASAIYSARYAVVFRPPAAGIFRARHAFLINQVEVGIPIYAPQVFSFAVQHANWPTIANTFSTSRDLQVTQLVAVDQPDVTFVWSMTRALLAAELAVMKRDMVMPFSMSRAGQVRELVLIQRPIETISWETVTSVAELTLMSLDRVPVPTSGAFYASYPMLALLAKPMTGMPASYTRDAQNAMKVLQRRVDAFPRSMLTSKSVAYLALIPNGLPLAQGPELVRQQFFIALQGSDYPGMNDPEYRKPADVNEVTTLALQPQGPQTPWVGVEHMRQMIHMTLSHAVIPAPFGMQHTKLATELVLVSSPTTPPGSMSGANAPSIRMQSLLRADGYPVASGIQSNTRLAQTGLKWLVDATYRSPGDIINDGKVSIYYSLQHVTLMRSLVAMPWSKTRVPELAQLTAMHAQYDSPGAVFNDGLFITLAAQSIMTVDQFPSTAVPNSYLQADVVIETVVTVDSDFPDKGFSISDLDVSKVVESVASEDNSFPDKDLPASRLIANIVAETVAAEDSDFPNPNMPLSQLQANLVLESVAVKADDYPPKDMVLSALLVNALVETVAQRDSFPDKDTPQSRLETSAVYEVIMTVDESMMSMPQYQGRRKPTIFVQIVY